MSDDRLANRYFLVVDDEAFIRNMVRRFLFQASAADVVETPNGQAAIDRLLRHDMVFDCVITDFEMKPTNGLELLKAIRSGAHGLKRNTPVLMLTSHARPHLVAAALALDADAFVAKPIARDVLVERIYRVIRRRVPIRDAAEYREAPVFDAVLQDEVPQSEASGEAVPAAIKPMMKAEIEPEPAEREERKRPQTVIAAFTKKPARPGQVTMQGLSALQESLVAAAILVPLGEVRPLSVLAQNVYGSDHRTLLVGMETVLTKSLLNRLKDLQSLHASLEKLLVVEPPETAEPSVQ